MLPPIESLLVLMVVGAAAGIALARRFEAIEPARLAHGYLVGVAALMAVRVAAYVAANVYGVHTVRPAGTGPRDLTNLPLGLLYGLAAVHARRGGFSTFFRAPDVRLALRLATGVAFVLAGLLNIFQDGMGHEFFLQAGYTKTFHLFIITAEVLGGVAVLIPWPWLTLTAAAGLTIDMFGAVYTQIRLGDTLEGFAPPIAMLLRLALLVGLLVPSIKGRWITIATGAIACAGVAIVGGMLLQK